jgi:hypothetical protein
MKSRPKSTAGFFIRACFSFRENVVYFYQISALREVTVLKTIGRVILSAIFLVLTGLMVSFAHFAPTLVFAFYPALSRKLLAAIASVTGAFPFALWEALAVLLILWALYTLVRSFRHHGFLRWLSGLAAVLCGALFVFVALWGLNHYGPDAGEKLGLSVRKYTRQELTSATEYYAAQVNALSGKLPRGADQTAEFSDFQTLSSQAGEGYQVLAQKYSCFSAAPGTVKKIASWKLFSYFGTTGIFVPFTAESCVNPDTYVAWIPFTMCHELAHRQAVAAEDDANFCAYLACMASQRAEFQYSGAFAAFIYCNNALAKVDSAGASKIWKTLDSGVQADALAANVHYAKYEGKVQDAAQKVNDAYLKAFSETAGVQSYGQVADLLIAWYLQNGT